MAFTPFAANSLLRSTALNGQLENMAQTDGSAPLIGPFEWEYEFTNRGTVVTAGAVGFAHSVVVQDNHNNNAITQGGPYVGVNGVDTVTQMSYTVAGSPANGVWAATDGLYLEGAGDGASAGNGHVSRYKTIYRQNMPINHTKVISATPTAVVTSVVVADGTSFGWGYPGGGGATTVSSTYPQSIIGQSGSLNTIIGYSGNGTVDAQGGPVGNTTLYLGSPMSIADATNGAVITNAVPSTSSPPNQVRGAALIGEVQELADYSGYSSDIAGAQENTEHDNRAALGDPIGQRKDTLHYFQLATTLLMLSQAGTIGAETLYVAQPTWPGCGYYPQISKPRAGAAILSTTGQVSNNTTVVSVVPMGLVNGTGPAILGDVYTYDTYEIVISQPLVGTIAAYSFGSGAEIAGANWVEFAQDIQSIITPNTTLDIGWQIAGEGTIATSVIDLMQINLGPNAAAVRVGRNHQVGLSFGYNFDAGRTQLTQGTSGTPQADYLRLIQQGREATFASGPMFPSGTSYTASGTIALADLFYTIETFGTTTLTLQLPLSTTCPADGIIAVYNPTVLLQRLSVNTAGGDNWGNPTVLSGTTDVLPGEVVVCKTNGGGFWSPIAIWSVYGQYGAALTTAQLNAIISAGVQGITIGRGLYALDGRNGTQTSGNGTGCPTVLQYTAKTGGSVQWCVVGTGAQVTA